MGHDYYDKDAVFNSYIKELANEKFDDTETIDESMLGLDVISKVEKVSEQILVS